MEQGKKYGKNIIIVVKIGQAFLTVGKGDIAVR